MSAAVGSINRSDGATGSATAWARRGFATRTSSSLLLHHHTRRAREYAVAHIPSDVRYALLFSAILLPSFSSSDHSSPSRTSPATLPRTPTPGCSRCRYASAYSPVPQRAARLRAHCPAVHGSFIAGSPSVCCLTVLEMVGQLTLILQSKFRDFRPRGERQLAPLPSDCSRMRPHSPSRVTRGAAAPLSTSASRISGDH